MKYKEIKFKIDPEHSFPFKRDKYCSSEEMWLGWMLGIMLILNLILLFLI